MEQISLYGNVKQTIQTMSRIEGLYYFVYELADRFHANEDTLSTIKTGVFDKQLIKTVTLRYKNESGKMVGKVVIDIDWEKHFFLVNTDDRKTLKFDLSKTVVDNVVGWGKIAVTHIDEIMKQFNVVSVEGMYRFRKQIYEDASVLQETRKLLDTEPIREKIDEQHIVPEFQKKLGAIFDSFDNCQKISGNMKKRAFDCGEMEEVSVHIYY